LEDLIDSEGGERRTMKSSVPVLCSSLFLLGLVTISLPIPIARLESRTPNFSAEPPNLGITNISSRKTVVGTTVPGRFRLTLGINVTNYGVEAETFNATFCVNSTIISEILNVTVEGQNSTVVVFGGIITGFAYGNYSISASITPVFNETELSDNFIDNFWVFFTILGDINGDKWVDIYDALTLAPVWAQVVRSMNANADLNDNGTIDIFDAILLAGNFGKHWE
jgi:hypothetical protein